jgi:transposase
LSFKEGNGPLVSYARNEKKIERKLRDLGFFALVTHKLDMGAMEVLSTYRMRDEQEKYFTQMKSLMMAHRQRNWSEDGKTGRLFILFCSLILSSRVTEVWKKLLTKTCSTSLEVLDEMRSIKCIEHKGRAKRITPFVGDQLTICEAFGFEVPKGCAPGYVSKKIGPKKRGRPRKPVLEN